jgi:hypothetical protein
VRSDRARLRAALMALALCGCSYEWDALRPRPDGGQATPDVTVADAPRADTGGDVVATTDVPTPNDGAADAGAMDAGTPDVGTMDVGAPDVGTPDVGTPDAGTPDVGTPDVGAPDVGAPDVGAPDTGPRDTGVVDAGVPDTGPPPCSGPLCPCAPTTPMGWCGVGATCTGGACAPGALMGALVITEIMNDPDVVGDQMGEWFEVYNRSATPVDLRGLRVRGSGSELFELTGASPLLVSGRGYAVLGKNADALVNGGVTMLYAYGSAMDLSNSTANTDSVTLLGSDGSTVIDSVTYANTVASMWPVIPGRSKSLRPEILDATMNDTSTAWCPGGPAFGRGDFGTPGAANVCQ